MTDERGPIQRCAFCGGFLNAEDGDVVQVGDGYAHEDCRDEQELEEEA